jgi:hypothetical protein
VTERDLFSGEAAAVFCWGCGEVTMPMDARHAAGLREEAVHETAIRGRQRRGSVVTQ